MAGLRRSNRAALFVPGASFVCPGRRIKLWKLASYHQLRGSVPAAALGVLISGLATPPLEGGLRALWPSVLKGPDKVHRAYALDAVAQEVMFAVGPLLLTLFVAVWNEAAGLLVINAFAVLGAGQRA